MNITVIGTGYVGLTTGACLANLGHHVTCADIDEEKIKLLEQGEIPFYEPGLKDIVLNNRETGRLRFTVDIDQNIPKAEVIFNCVGTPAQEDGSANLQYVFSVVEKVGRKANGYKLLVNKSTVPPGTAHRCQELLKQMNPATEVEVVSNPEFLKQGNAVYDFNHPDKIVLGAQSERGFTELRKVYSGLIKTYIPFVETTWETAELIKYANNSFLATKISFINEIANICDYVGADVKVVAKAIGMDYRIGPKFLNAGIGYGGSCFPKDVKALISNANGQGYATNLLAAVDEVNERQKQLFVPPILHKLEELRGDTVTLWGLSFKPKTSDLRGATSRTLIQQLLPAGVKLRVYDPVAMPEMKKLVGEKIYYARSPEDAVQGSSILVLVTEWDEFRNIDFNEIGQRMRHRVLFDGRNIYEPELVRQAGFEYIGVGRGNC